VGTPAEGTPAPHGEPSGCWCITSWGGFQRRPGLGDTPLTPLPSNPALRAPKHPISPQTQIPHHSVALSAASSSFQQRIPGIQRGQPALKVDFAAWKSSAVASLRQNAQGWGFGPFQGCSCKRPLQGYKK